MVIRDTRESGVARRVNAIHSRHDLGGCEGGTGASTPAPQALSDLTGRSPGLMLPWLTTLRTVRNAVHFATELVCDI
jgi:hypothetical protein